MKELRVFADCLRKQAYAMFCRFFEVVFFFKVVVRTREAMQKMIDFNHNKGNDMLNLECTLPNLADSCLHK